ncbi:hypothetical protein [Ktedonosporobacter rubrisoli]|nr:hypothetical protein [Ktedonosporobacter rubrisoli]
MSEGATLLLIANLTFPFLSVCLPDHRGGKRYCQAEYRSPDKEKRSVFSG